jgi:predicted nuclease of restriction endonuclease-like (RecB) superfamily
VKLSMEESALLTTGCNSINIGMNKMPQSDYQSFVMEIKEKIHKSQLKALQAVNRELLSLYSDIGKSIVEKQEYQGWGKTIVENLSKDLQKEFPGIKGFSVANLWRMRMFYLTYKENKNLAPLVREIGWSHNIIVLEKCKNDLERE